MTRKMVVVAASLVVAMLMGFYGYRSWAVRSGAALVAEGAPTFARGRDRLKLAHKLGSTRAANVLGSAYWEGTGVEKDPVEALKWLQPAADDGNVDALVTVGLALRDGIGVARDEKKAQAYIRKAAAEGQPKAMGLLAMDLLEGTHDEKVDAQEASKLARRGADASDPGAMYLLGKLFISNASPEHAFVKGMKETPSDGFRWIEKAATAGHPEACYVIGVAYVAMPKDKAMSFLIEGMQNSAHFNYPKGIPSVEGTLAMINSEGKHLGRDLKKAEDYILRAARAHLQGPGEFLVRNVYQSPSINPNPDPQRARKVLEQLTEAGDAWAPTRLGAAYTEGETALNVQKNNTEALRLLKIGAERGNKDATRMLDLFREASAPIRMVDLRVVDVGGFPRIQGVVYNQGNGPFDARVEFDLLGPNGVILENYVKTMGGIPPGGSQMIDIAIAPYHRNAQVLLRDLQWR